MKNCVLFASSIADSSKLHVLNELLSPFKENSNFDFFVGINPSSFKGTTDFILNYINPRKMEFVPEELELDSDASCYQTALRLLKESNERYDLYWFIHTKGGFNNRDLDRHLYVNDFIKKSNEIIQMFEKFQKLGSYSLMGNKIGNPKIPWDVYDSDHIIDICKNTKHNKFIYTHVNWSYINTIYVLNGKCINHFLDICPNDFYNKKINDRYYFETTPAWIPSRMGFFPYVKNKECYWQTGNLNDVTKKWIVDNNLLCDEFNELLKL